MAIRLIENGSDNRIEIDREVLDRSDGQITVNGSNSHVRIGKGSSAFARMSLTCGPASTVHIGDGVRLASAQIYICAGSKLIIGEHSSFANEGSIFAHEPKHITIGHGCLFAENVQFWVSDAHTIYDVETGARINFARSIHVGHRVWLGRNVSVFKGAHIGDGSVVGAHSLVTGAIPANALALGTPARVVRQGVSWKIDLVPEEQ